MVTGGDGQNKDEIPERLRSVPTTATSSVNTVASIAAARNMEVATVDVKQAYLNADMEGEVFMWIPEPIASVLCEREPSFKPFLHTNKQGQGRVLVQLLKAQYGCVESARLWYEHISKAIMEQGFQINPFDQCIFQRRSGDTWTYITLYVDDLMIVSDEISMVDEVIEKLTAKYTDLTVHRGKVEDYLGMRFDFSKKGEVFISMETYITEVLKGTGIEDTADTPAASDLFEIDEESPPLSNPERENFHRKVAQCLYAVTRTRPDASLPVIFLTTRVIAPTIQDQTKLNRIFQWHQRVRNISRIIGRKRSKSDLLRRR
jgi:hypothetical protein